MEYVPGIKINRIQALDQLGVDRKRYAIWSENRRTFNLKHGKQILTPYVMDADPLCIRLGRYAVESYLEQILSHGFFHADPVTSYTLLPLASSIFGEE